MSNQYTVTIEPSGIHFVVNPDEYILEAAKEQGVNLPYSCNSGVCGACKVQMTSGNVVHEKYDTQYALPDSEKNHGKVLTCRSKATSDLTLSLPHFSAEDLTQNLYKMKVTFYERIYDVAVIRLAFMDGKKFHFEAGQFINVVLSGNQIRSYSIANDFSEDSNEIELHIREQKNGVFSQYVFNYMEVGHTVQIRGPLGQFILEPSAKPIIFLATGTGFSSIKGMLENIAKQPNFDRTVYFYWGARKEKDLYALPAAEVFASSLSKYHFIPVLSDVTPEENWTGRTGLVHEAILKDFNDLSFYDIYACGAPPMLAAARNDFIGQRNLEPSSFHSDAFTPSDTK